MSGHMQTNTRKQFDIFRRILNLVVCFYFTTNLLAQDIHFSMFNSCPLFLNPAYTGNFVGDWRVALNFRNQWSAIEPFNTTAASFDKKVYLFNQKFGAGLFFVNDQAGSHSLSYNKIYASIAYNKEINKNYLDLGIQLGYVHQGLGGNQTYNDQYNRDNGNFDPNIPTSEPHAGEKHSYLDLNAGLLWKRNINIFEPEVGLAFFHLNSPNQSFFGGTDRLPLRYSLHTKVKTKISDDYYVMPSILYTQQKGATETMLGTNIGMNLFGNRSAVKEVFAGIYLRNGLVNKADAMSILAGATIRRIEIALCYDITVSQLSTATSNRSAFEISIIYRSISTVLNSYSIPCERF